MEVTHAIELAKEYGMTTAARLDVSTLRFMPEVREMCRADRCHSFGKNWMCPPACGTLEECADRARGYSRGLLVQTVGELEDSFDYEAMTAAYERHKENFEKLVLRLRREHPSLLALGAGACSICTECTYPAKPCRFPDRAVTSMEAAGLWVSDVCSKNGVAYNYGPERIAYTSCILMD